MGSSSESALRWIAATWIVGVPASSLTTTIREPSRETAMSRTFAPLSQETPTAFSRPTDGLATMRDPPFSRSPDQIQPEESYEGDRRLRPSLTFHHVSFSASKANSCVALFAVAAKADCPA